MNQQSLSGRFVQIGGIRLPIATLALLAAFAAVIGWSFLPTFRELSHKWFHDEGYSHGILVPFFAVYLLYARRSLMPVAGASDLKIGLACIGVGLTGRVIGGMFCFSYLDALSLLPILAGVALLLGGRAALRWSWPAVLYLFFMIPLPYRVEYAVGEPLQRIATMGSTFALQIVGQPAVAEGNIIRINDLELRIVEACSGLRMLLTFFAFSTAVAILIRKPLLERCLIVMSAVPIALVTNILRITVTGFVFQYSEKFGKVFFHDLAGWFMMPICLLLLGIELWILNRLIQHRDPKYAGSPLASRG